MTEPISYAPGAKELSALLHKTKPLDNSRAVYTRNAAGQIDSEMHYDNNGKPIKGYMIVSRPKERGVIFYGNFKRGLIGKRLEL